MQRQSQELSLPRASERGMVQAHSVDRAVDGQIGQPRDAEWFRPLAALQRADAEVVVDVELTTDQDNAHVGEGSGLRSVLDRAEASRHPTGCEADRVKLVDQQDTRRARCRCRKRRNW